MIYTKEHIFQWSLCIYIEFTKVGNKNSCVSFEVFLDFSEDKPTICHSVKEETPSQMFSYDIFQNFPEKRSATSAQMLFFIHNQNRFALLKPLGTWLNFPWGCKASFLLHYTPHSNKIFSKFKHTFIYLKIWSHLL